MNAARVISFLILLFSLPLPDLHAQELRFTPAGDQLGLPSNECYSVIQDRKGYIWIGGEAGLCRFNGSSTTVFDKKDGLSEGAVYALREDKGGGIWFITSANRILTCFHDSLVEAPFSKNYQRMLRNTLEQGYVIDFVKDSVFIGTQKRTFAARREDTSVVELSPKNIRVLTLRIVNGEMLETRSAESRTYQANMKDSLKFQVSTGVRERTFTVPSKSNSTPDWRLLKTHNKRNEFFVSVGNVLVKLTSDLDYSFTVLPYAIIDLYCDEDNELWAGTIKGGVYHFPNTNELSKKQVSLQGFSVSGTCVDKEKGVWCTSITKGTLYSPSKYLESFAGAPGLNKPADLMKNVNGIVFASSTQNELLMFGADSFKRHTFDLDNHYTICDAQKLHEGWLIAGKRFAIRTDSTLGHVTYIKRASGNLYAGASQFCVTENGRIFAILYGELIEISDQESVSKIDPLPSSGRCIFYEGKDRVLYGCKDGLYRMNIADFKSEQIPGIDAPVTRIIRTSFGEIWVATEEGLFSCTGNTTVNLTKKFSLPGERLLDITEDKYKKIWMASNTGLIRLSAITGHCSAELYTTLNGLPSDKINNIATDDHYLYFSGIEGICRVPLDKELRNTTAPDIYIKRVTAGNKDIDWTKPVTLAHDENRLEIMIDALTFKKPGIPGICYELIGNKDTLKREVTGKELDLDNLSSGKYELKVFAVNNDGVKSLSPAVMYFEVRKPFWSTLWFIALCILAVAGGMYLTVYAIVSRIRKREEEKTVINKQLAEFQLTALQAQMNPHFIFNAINSVQRYILEKSKQEAYDYLAKFGKLIRIVLHNSEEKIASLQEELEMLELYVELEQLRFSHSFEFKIVISPDVDIHRAQVPVMLIQPYIENAIWHGLMNLEKERPGKLELSVYRSMNSLIIGIADNGIGRRRAKEFKRESVHRPVAMGLAEKRLLTINKLQNYEEAKVTIIDLPGDSGTRVEITVPLIMENEMYDKHSDR